MKATKTLNIDATLHRVLKARSVEEDMLLGEFVEAVLRVGLDHPEELTKRLSEVRTTLASPPE